MTGVTNVRFPVCLETQNTDKFIFKNFNSYKTMAYGSKKRFSSRRGTKRKGGKKSFKRKSSKKVLGTYRMSRGGGRL